MAGDPKRYARLLKVRALQRDLAQAEEVHAAAQADRTGQLLQRIARLVDDVTPGAGSSSGLDLAAAAGFRRRLQHSHADAEARAATAAAVLARRQQATREAMRDHGAIEKLTERARARAAVEAMRKLADAPAVRRPGMKLADDPEK